MCWWYGFWTRWLVPYTIVGTLLSCTGVAPFWNYPVTYQLNHQRFFLFSLSSKSHLFHHWKRGTIDGTSGFHLLPVCFWQRFLWIFFIDLLPFLNWYFNIIVFPFLIILESLVHNFSPTKLGFITPQLVANFEHLQANWFYFSSPFPAADTATFAIFAIDIHFEVCVNSSLAVTHFHYPFFTGNFPLKE